MGDDGIGPLAISLLSQRRLPPWVRLVEGGTDALALSSLWEGEPRLWIIDAVRRGASPGTVHRLDHDDLLRVSQTHESAHQLSLAECLRLLTHAFPSMADVHLTLWGVEPARIELCLDLSDEARKGVCLLINYLEPKISGSAG